MNARDPDRDDPDIPADAENDVAELYEHAPCAFLSRLPDGTIVRANQTFFDWFGMDPGEVVGLKRFQSLLTVGSRIYHETHYAPLLQMQGFVNEIALEMRRADGTVRPVVASARQVRGADGTVRVNRVALFDSTHRRRYEQELVEARKRAEEVTRQLEKTDRLKTEFMAMLARELRNPLAPIRNALEVQRQSGNDPATIEKTSGMIYRQVGQMVRLVEDLFDMSRIGQDKLTVRRVPVDLASIIHHAAESSDPLFASAGIVYSASLPDAPVYVDGDAARLVQAIGNILNNAAKFTPAGGQVLLTAERDGAEVLVRIRDTGIGIDAAVLPRLFDMFMQVEASSSQFGGLGIGLALAKNLIERHDGRIAVHSEGLDKGAEFTIRLPALSVAPESVLPSFPHPIAPVTPEAKRVLVVDDNHDSAMVMTMLLEFAGHEVRQAHDGLQAVAAVSEFQPHVVLLDIGLPRMNGYEAAQRIRALPGLQPVLVALTGWGQAEDRRKSAAAGFHLHLLKPVDHNELTKVIAEAHPGSAAR